MTDSKRHFVLFLILYLLAAAVCVYTGIGAVQRVFLIENFAMSYFWAAWAQSFIAMFPAVTLTGIVIGYTYRFAALTEKKDSTVNYEHFFIGIIKQLCIIALVFSAVVFLCRETVLPVARHTCTAALTRSADYQRADGDLDAARLSGDDAAVLDALNRLFAITGTNQELLPLYESVSARMQVKEAAKSSVRLSDGGTGYGGMNLSFNAALEKAEAAKAAESWFDMHYYASIGIKLADERNPDHDRVLRLAAEAWNMIGSQQKNLETREEEKRYAQKLKGYGALQQEDYLKSYYIFKELQNDRPDDPDVVRYLNFSRQGLENSYFFINETEKLVFRSSRSADNDTFCNFFLLRTPEDAVQVVYFDKIAWKNNNGSRVLYVQNFEALEFSPYGKLLYQIRTPYAKILPCNTSDSAIENWQTVALLTAVDSQHADRRFQADVIKGELFSEKSNFMVLDISMIELVRLMEKKPLLSDTPLLPLLFLYENIEKYGFSQNALLAELIFRVSHPLLLVLLVFLAVWCSWKFRITAGRRFKKRYFCFVPLFFIILYGLNQFFEYVYKCLVYVSVEFMGIYTAVIVFVLVFLLLVWVVISLSCQRNS